MPSARTASSTAPSSAGCCVSSWTRPAEQRPAEAVRADWSGRPGAQMFANRLRKNLQRLDPWAEREHIDCFRVYDADMPEYAFAIDLYGRGAPARLCPGICSAQDGQSGKCPGAPPRGIGGASGSAGSADCAGPFPGAQAAEGQRAVREARLAGPNVTPCRKAASNSGSTSAITWIRDCFSTTASCGECCASGRKAADFLNLFCYTGSATVYAAAGGARSSASVDLSNTYLDWAHENLLLNGFRGSEHELYRADCLQWLEEQEPQGPRFDLIFVDPPTFSNSKRMDGVLDVQRDHVGHDSPLDEAAAPVRAPGILDQLHPLQARRGGAGRPARRGYQRPQTIPKDFERHARIHRCFSIRFK